VVPLLIPNEDSIACPDLHSLFGLLVLNLKVGVGVWEAESVFRGILPSFWSCVLSNQVLEVHVKFVIISIHQLKWLVCPSILLSINLVLEPYW